jgi:hypothetical protein
MAMGGKTLGFPHALGWIRGGLMKQTRMESTSQHNYIHSVINSLH